MQSAVMHYTRVKKKRLGDFLMDEGLITKEAVIAALHEQQVSNRLLSSVLLESEDVSEFELARAIVEHQHVPFLELSSYNLHKELVEGFDAEFLNAARVVPMENFGGRISFAVQEVPSEAVVEKLMEHADKGMYFFIALASNISRALREYAPVQTEEEAMSGVAADKGWTNLFDTANESILSDIVEPDAVDVELVSGGEESTDAAEGADGLGILDDIE
ncbi:MAG: hypothetical protein V3T86_09860 [Planctomycetota bacterium]